MLRFQALIAEFAFIMAEFFNVLPPGEALALLLDMLPEQPDRAACVVDTSQALGRVSPAEIRATESLPAFARSTMDGYSVRAADTYGATDGLPAWFTLMGEVPMGREPNFDLGVGQAAAAYTGGMLAGNADAVVMVEHTQAIDAHTIEVMRPVAPGENVAQARRGRVAPENAALPAGARHLPAGHRRAAGAGDRSGSAVAQPSAGGHPVHGRRDCCSPAPGARPRARCATSTATPWRPRLSTAGAIPRAARTWLGDDYEEQLDAAREAAWPDVDMMVLSAGSSVSARDWTVDIVGERWAIRVRWCMGSRIRPGQAGHRGAVRRQSRSSACPAIRFRPWWSADLLVRPTLYRLMGCAQLRPRRSELTAVPPWPRTFRRPPGREDYVPVRLESGRQEDAASGRASRVGQERASFSPW